CRMELKDVDLNLLVVFNQLLAERRVSAAASVLGVSQPAVSNALNRLRRLLGDELFLRTSRGMEPTPFAEQLAGPIRQAVSTIHTPITQRAVSEPSESTRSFTIAMTDIGEIALLSGLMSLPSEQGPGIALSRFATRPSTCRMKWRPGGSTSRWDFC